MPIAIEASPYPEIMILDAANPLSAADFEVTDSLGLDKKLLYVLLDATGATLPDGILNGASLVAHKYLLHLAVVVDQPITFQPTPKVSLHHNYEAAFDHLTNLREADNPPTL